MTTNSQAYLGPEDGGNVASGPERGSSAMHGEPARRTSERLPALSGTECAHALRRIGFQVELGGPDRMVVKCYGLPVGLVPVLERLSPVQLLTILRMIRVTPEWFGKYVDE